MKRINKLRAAALARPAILAASIAAVATPAQAQSDPISQVNAFYSTIAEDQRSDLVVLPLVAKMDPLPAGLNDQGDAIFLHADSEALPDAAAWAASEPQQAVLQALAEVTEEPDPRFGMAFGLPYGVEALSDSDREIDLIADGMYVELDVGGTPLLGGADFKYLDGLRNVEILVFVEARRQQIEGNPRRSIEVLVDWLRFSRQLADREFLPEKMYGMQSIVYTLQAIRDVLYEDFRGPKLLRNERDFLGEVLLTIPERLDRESLGALAIDRIAFPRVDRIAADQMARFVLDGDGVNERTWATTMGRLISDGNPLLLFSVASQLEQAGRFQAPLSEALAANARVFGDFNRRWNFPDPYDATVRTRYDFERLPLGRYVVTSVWSTAFAPLLDFRQTLRAEAIGTRQSLAMLALYYRTNQFPTSLAATRNRDWYPELEADPFLDGTQPLGYLVPERDTPGVLSMGIVTDAVNFGREFRDDEFVIFAAGTDRTGNLAREVQNTSEEVFGADYLIWPPLFSLARSELIRRGELP